MKQLLIGFLLMISAASNAHALYNLKMKVAIEGNGKRPNFVMLSYHFQSTDLNDDFCIDNSMNDTFKCKVYFNNLTLSTIDPFLRIDGINTYEFDARVFLICDDKSEVEVHADDLSGKRGYLEKHINISNALDICSNKDGML